MYKLFAIYITFQLANAALLDDISNTLSNIRNVTNYLLEPFICVTDLVFDPTRVHYTLYRRESPEIGVPLNWTYLGGDLINSADWTLFICQGWLEDLTIMPWPLLMKDEYFKMDTYNVVIVDWSYYAQRELITANCAIPKVGNSVGVFMHRFITGNGIDYNRVQFNGFSYGAQIAGYAGQMIFRLSGQKIRRITGMDPGGPGFEVLFQPVLPDFRLSEDDAREVTVIHSSAIIGMTRPIGHVDFFVNGGKYQPFCPFDLRDLDLDLTELIMYVFCSHIFATTVKILSINTIQLVGTRCNFDTGICDDSDRLLLSDSSAEFGQGQYYFNLTEEQLQAFPIT